MGRERNSPYNKHASSSHRRLKRWVTGRYSAEQACPCKQRAPGNVKRARLQAPDRSTDRRVMSRPPRRRRKRRLKSSDSSSAWKRRRWVWRPLGQTSLQRPAMSARRNSPGVEVSGRSSNFLSRRRPRAEVGRSQSLFHNLPAWCLILSSSATEYAWCVVRTVCQGRVPLRAIVLVLRGKMTSE